MNNQPDPLDRKALLKNALIALDEMQSRLDAVERAQHEPIAVIGMGCRFPGGANNPEAYWQLLRDGVDAVREVPPERWDIHEYDDLRLEKPIAWYGGFLDNIDQFDPQFFGISPREANSMDPQQRLVLEVSWEALEHAGQPPDKLNGTQTGVFVGVTTNDYAHMVRSIDPTQMDVYAATGSALNAIPGRVAYTLGLHGPSISVDTACSSSLVAIHLACKSLRSKESDLALAGGVNATLTPEAFICFAGWGMMAPDGRCKTFDSHADGFVRGEGCGMLVLKRLSDALAAGDRIQAVIRGSAVNQDGRSSGLTVPNGRAQQAVIRAALKDAGVTPAEVSYVEAHGTGTSLGDPIEIEAIGAALSDGRPAGQPLTVGSVKTNIGHLESASGVAGVIKTILSMQHREIPPHLHLQERSQRIPWPGFPIEIPAQPTTWEPAQGARIAGVSSFGFSGANAHVVLEEAPAQPEAGHSAPHAAYLLPLSAKTDSALSDLSARYARRLADANGQALAQVGRTAALGRALFARRLAVTGASPDALKDGLEAFAAGQPHPAVISGQAERGGPGKVAFLFTGQGAQWEQMGRELYQHQPVFRQALDECDALLRPYLPEPLLSVIFAEEHTRGLLDHTRYTQPALFALEYALVQLWKSWGVQPAAVLGHSVGEYAAACAAGVFSLSDGIRLIAARARLMGELPAGGQMAAVFASEARVLPFLEGSQVSVAAVNGPENTVISGGEAELQAVREALQADGIQTRMLQVSHAFHSALMEPILDSFEQSARAAQYAPPALTLISNVTGKPETALVCDPRYWRTHIRQPVRFQQGIQALYEMGFRTFVEIGPGPVLNGMAQRCLPEGEESLHWLASLRKGRGDEQQMLESLGALWVRGLPVHWPAVYQDAPTGVADLPTYPFQYERFWLEVTAPAARNNKPAKTIGGHPLLGSRLSSPLIKDTVVETHLSVHQPHFLNDHRLNGRAVFPGTGYLETGMAVGMHIFNHANCAVEDLSILNMMTISDDQERVMQTVITARENLPAKFQVFSLEEGEQQKWTLHAEGTVAEAAPQALPNESLDECRARCTEPVEVEAYYQTLEAVGLGYGPRFRCLQTIWRKENEAFGEVTLPEEFASEATAFALHPGLLDACFQLLGAALPRQKDHGEAQVFYVPVSIGRYQLLSRAADHLLACMSIEKHATDSDKLTGNILLFASNGECIGTIQNLQVRKITSAARMQPKSSPLYQQRWVPVPLPDAPAHANTAGGNWLIIENEQNDGAAFAEVLNEMGTASCVVDASQIEIVLDGKAAPDGYAGMVYLCGNSAEEIASLEALRKIQHDVVGSQVSTAQAVLRASGSFAARPAMVFVTRGAQAVAPGDTLPALAHAAVWGIGKTLSLENPQSRCICVDLDPSTSIKEGMRQLAGVLQAAAADDPEDRVAFRAGTRYAARLARVDSDQHDDQKKHGHQLAGHVFDKPFRLSIVERGMLDNITFQAAALPAPGPEQMIIQVEAAGLNFRDVLNVLGMLPGAEADLGHECAGRVIAVGEKVTHFQVGDEVMGIASGSFATYAVTHQDLAIHRPANMNAVEAATIPLAFLTAYYGLVHLGKLQKGERILIHAAAGGVGMAAVQIALQAGAEVFATAGSAEKRAFLKSLGVQHVMDSRSLAFAGQIMEATGSAGVDMVLNSLIDDFIHKSFAVLRPGGRFLEIGKRGIWTHDEVKALGKEHQYHIIFLGEVCINDSALIRSMLQTLSDHLSANRLKPLPTRVYPAQQAVDAFRYMAQAKHIGKIVLTWPQQAVASQADASQAVANAEHSHQPVGIRADASYMITGGLGGIGVKAAEWLAASGAKSIALVGRSQPSAEAAARIEQIRADGAQVCVYTGDLASAEDVQRILHEMQTAQLPLAGVLHAAGVLDDGLFTNLTWENYERVFAPKVYGAWNLHTFTAGMPLDFFILFSAGAALLGSPGQSNYSGANAFLDAFAHFRRAQGLPALSINWGPWGEVGMAARLSQALQMRWENQGIQMMAPEACFQCMENLVTQNAAQAAVFDINWPVFLRQFGRDQKPPFFAEMAAEGITDVVETGKPAGENILAVLSAADPKERSSLLEKHLKGLVGRVIGFKTPERISISATLTELGIDSLMAIELRNRIQESLHIDIPLSMFFGTTSLTDLNHTITAIIWTAKEMQAAVTTDKGEREDFQL